MTALLIILALLLPALMGSAWTHALLPRRVIARPFMVLGTGTLLGLLVLPQIMRLWDTLGWGLAILPTLLTCLGLTLLALAPGLRRGVSAAHPYPTPTAPMGHAERLLLALLLAMIALRLVTLATEVSLRPLFPWDATMHWATKARVWFEHQAMVPFVDHNSWLERSGSGVYTDRHPHYPATIPLLQVWMTLMLGQWNESAMNMPWLLCFMALGAIFYGQARLAGASTTLAVAFTYLLLSLPLLNTHVALAGYADMFLGAAFGCAVMCLHNWARLREPWLAVLALAFALLCPLIKNEGLIWALTLIPALAVALMQRREAAKFFVLLVLLGLLAVLVAPKDLAIVGHTIRDFRPSFNQEALLGIVYSIFQHSSWHLLGYLILMLVPLGLVMPGALTRKLLILTTVVACAAAAYFFLFVFTGFGAGAENFAAVGRLAIHLAPAGMFLAMLIYQELLARQRAGGILQEP